MECDKDKAAAKGELDMATAAQVNDACQEIARRLDSPAGCVEIKRSRFASLPKPGTPQREQLLALITEAQRWPDVAYPNAGRLLKAIDGGLFTPQQVGEIVRLCPVQEICRLAVHANG